jgi:uncharacterized membrane protein YedE/YeeE
MDIGLGLVLGLVLGVLFGVILQRGRFCMNSAFQDVFIIKDFTLFKAILVAIMVQIIGFLILATTGLITGLYPQPFFIVSIIVGGLIFGVGMVLAGGCLSGTMYRVGEGMVGSIVALVGFIFIMLMNSFGAFTGITSFLKGLGQVTVINPGPYVENNNFNPTLANILGLNPWLVGGLIVIGILVYLIWSSYKPGQKISIPKTGRELYNSIFKKGWRWWVTGIALGIIGIVVFPLIMVGEHNEALCLTCGWIGFSNFVLTGDFTQLNVVSLFVIGIISGAAIGAVLADEFKIRIPEAKRLIQQLIGGMLLGFGALLTGGCNIGHILSGIPQLAVSSIVMGIFVFIGCWIAASLLYKREKV